MRSPNSSTQRMPFLLTLTLWTAACLFQIITPQLVTAAQGAESAPKSLFTLKDVTDTHLTLIPLIHLVPPGSTLVYKDKPLTELKGMAEGKQIEALAKADINFFQTQLKKQLGNDKKLTLQEARFDVNKDFMGKLVTDLLSLKYTIAKP